eukprot:Skav219389  [mRNA]  locus=scaffold2133:36068:37216:- [translate_table: standard]
MARGVHEAAMTGTPADVFQSIYVDDRFISSTSSHGLQRAIAAWSLYSKRLHLLEHPEKMQVVNLAVQPDGFMNVLGTLIGGLSRAAFHEHPKHKERFRSAMSTARRVALLPISSQAKLETLNMFAASKASYGWIHGRIPGGDQKAFNNLIWKAAGRYALAPPTIRTLLSGCHLEIHFKVLLSQIRTLGLRNQVLSSLGFQFRNDLDQMVNEQIIEYGWYFDGHQWHHESLSYSFLLSDVCDDKKWESIAHSLRQSFRWYCHGQLATSQRREFREKFIPEFDESRLELARRWMRMARGTFPLAIGAVASGKAKQIIFGSDIHCKRCGVQHPTWQHLWHCVTGENPPDDIFLERFLWPRNASDFKTCLLLAEAVSDVHGDQRYH